MTTSDPDEKVLFALSPPNENGVPLLLFLMPEKGWDYMAAGLGHEFDLTKIGLPIKVVIGRCRTRAHGVEIIEGYTAGHPVKDVSGQDMGLTRKKKEEP